MSQITLLLVALVAVAYAGSRFAQTDLGKTILYLTWYAVNTVFVGPLSGFLKGKSVNEKTVTPKNHDCCKQSYLKHRQMALSEKWDTVIIGSGMGGLSAASSLARLEGQKVLVLEQHDIAGGCCHVFEDKGFEFDTGVHYIGEMNNDKHILAFVMSWLTRGKPWQPMDDCFDEVSFGPDVKLDICKGRGRLGEKMAEMFPKERENIIEYLKLCRDMGDCLTVGRAHLCLPKYTHFYVKLALKAFFKIVGAVLGPKRDLYGQYEIYSCKTVQDVIEETTEDLKLRNVLCHPAGDYGAPAKDAPFCLHGAVMSHYFHGASYPVGGPQELVRGMVPAIEECGGKVLVKAEVSEIVLNSENEACGVRLGGKFSEDIIFADNVISGVGAFNTYCRLIPEKHHSIIEKELKLFKDTSGKGEKPTSAISTSPGHIYLFVGLKGDEKELGIKAKNYWMYNKEFDPKRLLEEYYEDLSKSIPGVFASFPSAKDPSFKERFPGKSTAVVLCEAYHHHFSEWYDQKVKHRGEEYEKLKEEYAKRLFDILYERFPNLKGKVEYYEVGTPCTNNYYLGASHGGSYGLEHTVKRIHSDGLSVFTPIKNLYLTGQDTMCCGLVAAMMSGVLTASAVSDRNLMPAIMRESSSKGYLKSQTSGPNLSVKGA
eukprot:Nk52_evm17s273 gene=Nk52_evmTU17s273